MLNKKKLKKLAIFMIVGGFSLAGVAYVSGGETTVDFVNGGLRVATRDLFSETVAEFSSLHIDVGSSNINLRQGTEFRIEADIVGDLTYSVVDGLLHVATVPGSVFTVGPINVGGRFANVINIYAPLDYIENANIINRSGSIDSEIGLVNSRIESTTGNIRLADLSNVTISSTTGNVRTTGNVSGDLVVTSTTGNVNLNIWGYEENYSIIFTRRSGNVTIGGSRINNRNSGTFTFPAITEEIGNIRLDVTSGNINVNFR